MIKVVNSYLNHTIESKPLTKCIALKDYQLIYWWKRSNCLATEDRNGTIRRSTIQ